jgi:hypothetical protein
MSMTCTVAGQYAFMYSDTGASGSVYFGLSLNSSNLSTNFGAIGDAEALVAGSTRANQSGLVHVIWPLAVGDVVRAHAHTGLVGTDSHLIRLLACRVNVVI